MPHTALSRPPLFTPHSPHCHYFYTIALQNCSNLFLHIGYSEQQRTAQINVSNENFNGNTTMKNTEFTLTRLARIGNLWGAIFASGSPSIKRSSEPGADPVQAAISFAASADLPRVKVAALISQDNEPVALAVLPVTAKMTINAHPVRRPGLAPRWKDPHRLHIGQSLSLPAMSAMRQL